jgi:hypothetical protein
LLQGALHGLQPTVEREGSGGLIGRPSASVTASSFVFMPPVARPIRVFITVGQISDDARALVSNLPSSDWL